MINKINISTLTRFGIQLLFFLTMPALFSTAFNGIKYIGEQIHLKEAIVWNPFIAILIVLLLFTMVFGRFFCGYACAFGSMGDWLFTCSSFLQKKIRKKVFKLSDKTITNLNYLKYIVLIGIVAACITGTYSYISKADPWEIFASFISGDFNVTGKHFSLVILILILVGMCFVERFFCQFLCPMGAAFALIPELPLTIFNRKKEECIPGCSLCIKTCPASISLGESGSRHNDCFQCGKCSIKCPKENVRLGFRKLQGTEIWLVAGKTVILFAVSWIITHGN